MDKDNITFTLAQCIADWEKQGVVNLEWLSQENPDTTVDYVVIPDIFSTLKNTLQGNPSWCFPTSQGKFRFIIRDGYLYPEKVFEPCGKIVEHRSRHYDTKYEVDAKLNTGQTERKYFRSSFAHGLAQIARNVEHVSAEEAMIAWKTFGDGYKEDIHYVLNEYKRRKAFAKYSGMSQLVSNKPDCCFLDGFNLELRYMILECEFAERINQIFLDPLNWTNIDTVSEQDRRDFFLHMWEVPGAQPLLSKLATMWNVTGWSMLETFLETDSFPLQAVQADNATVRSYVSNALGLKSQDLPEITLPAF